MTDSHNGSPLAFHPNGTCEKVTYQIKLDAAAPPKRLGGISYFLICSNFPILNNSIPHKRTYTPVPGARDSTKGGATSSKNRCADSTPGWSLRKLMARNSGGVQYPK